MILDWDVHHGNGTNDIFHDSNQVLFVSIHQSPLYPGTGPATDVGTGEGRGFTVNLPVRPGAGDEVFCALVDRVAVPLAQEFAPQLVLISAGYDAHRGDPLGQCDVTDEGYAAMTRSMRWVGANLEAPVGCVLEGGYALDALGRSVAATMAALQEPAPATPPATTPDRPRHRSSSGRSSGCRNGGRRCARAPSAAPGCGTFDLDGSQGFQAALILRRRSATTPLLVRRSLEVLCRFLVSQPAVSSEVPAAPGALAVSMRGVVKRFASALAVDGLTLEVPSGLCYGLLGPNGAGKSTTMRILTGQSLADAGGIQVLGYELPAESKLARARMGVCPQESNLDVDLRVRDVLAVFARLYRVPKRGRAAAVDRALGLAGLEARAFDRAVTLSGGMQRRLLIARALIHDPDLVLLDEPTVGLDPQVRQELWSLRPVAARAGRDRADVHPLHRGGRGAGGPRGDHVGRPRGGGGVAGRSRARRMPAARSSTCTERWRNCARCASTRRPTVLPTRQSGPALTYLHADAVDGRVPAGRRRAATLEDVFVRLTGDYVE